MKANFEAIIAKYQERVLSNEPIENVILSLHNNGCTIVESMEAIMILYKKSLGEAKILVTNHPVWKDVVKAHGPFHDELVEMWVVKKGEEYE